jgi:hypothetical protein
MIKYKNEKTKPTYFLFYSILLVQMFLLEELIVVAENALFLKEQKMWAMQL